MTKSKTTLLFFSSSAMALLGGALLQFILFRKLFPMELLAGWALTLAHGALALWINVRAIGPNTTRFFLLGLGLNGIRFIFLVVLPAFIKKIDKGSFFPFAVITVWGYLVFMVSEIWTLHKRSMRDNI